MVRRRTPEQIDWDAYDLELLRRFKRGDDQAYTMLSNRYQYLVLKLAHSYDRYEPEDFAQLLRVEFWRLVKDFKISKGIPFWAWVNWTLPRHAKHFAARKARQRASEPQRTVLIEGIVPAPAEPDSFVRRQQRLDARRAMQLIAETTPNAAELFRLTVLGGLSVSEAAKRLGINNKTAESRIHKAKLKLRKIKGEIVGNGG